MAMFASSHDKRQGTLMQSILTYCSGISSKAFNILKRPREDEAYLDAPKKIKGNGFSPVIDKEIRSGDHRWRRTHITSSFFQMLESEWGETVEVAGKCLKVICLCAGFAQNTVMQRELLAFIRELKEKYNVADFYDEEVPEESEILLLANAPKRISNAEIFQLYNRLGQKKLKVGICINNQESIDILHTSPPLPLGVQYHRLAYGDKKITKSVTSQTDYDELYTPLPIFNFTKSCLEEEKSELTKILEETTKSLDDNLNPVKEKELQEAAAMDDIATDFSTGKDCKLHELAVQPPKDASETFALEETNEISSLVNEPSWKKHAGRGLFDDDDSDDEDIEWITSQFVTVKKEPDDVVELSSDDDLVDFEGVLELTTIKEEPEEDVKPDQATLEAALAEALVEPKKEEESGWTIAELVCEEEEED